MHATIAFIDKKKFAGPCKKKKVVTNESALGS